MYVCLKHIIVYFVTSFHYFYWSNKNSIFSLIFHEHFWMYMTSLARKHNRSSFFNCNTQIRIKELYTEHLWLYSAWFWACALQFDITDSIFAIPLKWLTFSHKLSFHNQGRHKNKSGHFDANWKICQTRFEYQ